jgi:hypothetical protein
MNKPGLVGVKTAGEPLQAGSLIEITRSGNYGKRCMRGKIIISGHRRLCQDVDDGGRAL